MFLSRMFLNPRRRDARRLTADPQAMHAAVMSAFPPDAHDAGRVLWRIDDDADRLSLFVVSPTMPSFDHLQEQAGWSNQPTWDVRPYAQVVDRLMKGQEYSFRLAANPVRIVTGDDGVKRRHAHLTAPQQLSWLIDRSDRLGVEFPSATGLLEGEPSIAEVAVTGREQLRFRRQGHPMTLTRVRYDGQLRVVDPAALRAVMIDGIGKGKAYGCGLLTLAPRRR